MPVPLYPLEDWISNVALGALSSRETVRASYDLACAAIAAGVPGDFVECGVYNGSQCASMARAIIEDSKNIYYPQPKNGRRVHLFDTFAGIPQASQQDLEFQAAGHPEGVSACSLEAVQAHMAEWSLPAELFKYHPGLFSQTARWGRFADRREWGVAVDFPNGIAVLRLDGDLYQSTKDCMPLVELVNPGGWIIVDDYHLSGCRQAITEALGYPSPIAFQKHKGTK